MNINKYTNKKPVFWEIFRYNMHQTNKAMLQQDFAPITIPDLFQPSHSKIFYDLRADFPMTYKHPYTTICQ